MDQEKPVDSRAARSANIRRYLIESGLVKTAAEMHQEGHSQTEIAEIFTERKYTNYENVVSWRQPYISRLLKIAREQGLYKD